MTGLAWAGMKEKVGKYEWRMNGELGELGFSDWTIQKVGWIRANWANGGELRRASQSRRRRRGKKWLR